MMEEYNTDVDIDAPIGIGTILSDNDLNSVLIGGKIVEILHVRDGLIITIQNIVYHEEECTDVDNFRVLFKEKLTHTAEKFLNINDRIRCVGKLRCVPEMIIIAEYFEKIGGKKGGFSCLMENGCL